MSPVDVFLNTLMNSFDYYTVINSSHLVVDRLESPRRLKPPRKPRSTPPQTENIDATVILLAILPFTISLSLFCQQFDIITQS